MLEYQTDSCRVVWGQRISSSVAAFSTLSAPGTDSGSARKAAQVAMSVALLHSCAAGATPPVSIARSGHAWSE
jgi:hypothetical protein